MSMRRRSGGGGFGGRSQDEIREVGNVVRDQLNILRSLTNKESEMIGDISTIQSKIKVIEKTLNNPSRGVMIDWSFMMDCYNLVTFADRRTLTRLFNIGKKLMKQKIVKFPDPYNTMMLTVEFIFVFMVCLHQHIRHMDTEQLSRRVSVNDSMSDIASIISGYMPKDTSSDVDKTKKSIFKRLGGKDKDSIGEDGLPNDGESL